MVPSRKRVSATRQSEAWEKLVPVEELDVGGGGQAAHLYLTAGHGGAAEPRVTAFKVETHSSQGGCEELVSPEPCYQTLSPNKIKWHVNNCGKHSQFLGGMVGWTEKENRISNYCGNVYIEITCSVSVPHLKYLFFSFKHGHILLCVIWL